MLHRFRISRDSLCSFCNLEEETPVHIFYNYNHDLLHKKKTKKEGVIVSALTLFLPMLPLWFSILNNLLIMDSLIGIMSP